MYEPFFYIPFRPLAAASIIIIIIVMGQKIPTGVRPG